MKRTILATVVLLNAFQCRAEVTDEDISRALERAATLLSFSSRMYIDCATKAVAKVDDGVTEISLVADALRYRCLESFKAASNDIPELIRASTLAELQPTIVEVVKTARRQAAQKVPQLRPKPKPSM